LAEYAVVGGRAEHDAAAFGPAQLGVRDLAATLSGHDEGFDEAEGFD
jgi:hypothetical protein